MSASGPPLAARGRPAVWLFALIALALALAGSGFVHSPDGVVMGRVTQTLAEHGGLWVDEPRLPPGFVFPGPDGRLYAKYGVGQSLAGVPFWWLGRALAALAPARSTAVFEGMEFLWYDPHRPADAWGFFALSLTNSVVVAATGALLFLLALELGYRRRTAAAVALLATLGSPLLVYGRTFFAEPLAALALVGFALAAARAVATPPHSDPTGRPPSTDRPSTDTPAGTPAGEKAAAEAVSARTQPVASQPGAPQSVAPQPGDVPPGAVSRPARWAAFLAGLALGLAVLAKIAHGVLLPVGGAVLLWSVARRWPGRRGLPPILAFAAGVLAMLAVVGWSNWARFGRPWRTGYEAEMDRWFSPLTEGLAGLLASPGRGLLLYFPTVLLAAACTRAGWRRHPPSTLLAWGSLAALLLLYARWGDWHGGWCWGPRFLVPALPLLALLCAPFFETPPTRPLWRWGGRALVAASALLAVSGTLVPFTEFHLRLLETYGRARYLQAAAWDWAHWPPRAYLSFEPRNSFLLQRALATPDAWWLAALGAAALVLLALLAAGLARRLGPIAPRPLSPRARLVWMLAALSAALVTGLLTGR